MSDFVRVKPPAHLVPDDQEATDSWLDYETDPALPEEGDYAPGAEIVTREPSMRAGALFLVASLGFLVTAYLCYIHLFEAGSCVGGVCKGVLESAYGRVLGIPLAAFGLALFTALAYAAARRELGWARLLSIAGFLPAPFLIYIQSERLHEWCPLCVTSTGLIFVSMLLCVRGGSAMLELSGVPRYLIALALPVGLVWGVQHGMAVRDTRNALAAVPTERTGTVSIAGRTYRLAQIDRAISTEIGRLDWEKHRARLDWVERQVLAREAEQQGLSVAELVKRNIDYRVGVSEEEILAKYRADGGTGREIPHDVRMQIAAKLALKRRPQVEEEYLTSLYAKHGVSVGLTPPDARGAVAFNPRGGPERGPEDAALEIIVFSDFACPACVRVHEWLGDVSRQFGVPVRVAFRHFPLGPPGPAAAAAVAAHEQGKFWEFADILFAHRNELDPARITEYATKAGLDLDKLRGCVASDRPRLVLAADVDEAKRLGVQAAPTLFINGVHFVGVPSPRLIRAILQRDSH